MPEDGDRERAQRNEMTHACAADEEQQRHEQSVQHRNGEIRLKRGQDVEQADDDEKGNEPLR